MMCDEIRKRMLANETKYRKISDFTRKNQGTLQI